MTPQEWIDSVTVNSKAGPGAASAWIEVGKKHLAAALEEIARLRADASAASPSCDRCQSAHCCSVRTHDGERPRCA